MIEIDGSQHYEENGIAYDEERSAYLQSLGLKVVRYSNREITWNFKKVCEQIDGLIRERSAQEK